MEGVWSRRRFLHASAAAAAAAALGSACSSSDAKEAAPRSSTTEAPSTTTTMSPQKRSRLDDIEHVVILFQENRSFDQIFGTRKDVRGFGDPDVLKLPDGKPIWYQPNARNPDGYVLPFPMTATGPGGQCGGDVDHSWEGQHVAWNGGKMDGYAERMGQLAMGYYRRQDLPWYYALADEFTLCDSWFCSVLGPTNPNRYYSMTGTIDPQGRNGGPAIDNSGKGYTWETYPERLTRAGITWRVYHDVDDFDDNMLANFVQFQEVKKPDVLWDSGMRTRTVAEFEADCANDALPQVSWIVAPEAQSEHPIFSPAGGQAYTKRHLDAIFANPKVWAKTVFILSYDENGGFFDHVPPPVPEPDTPDEWVGDLPIGLGPRVPGLVISPWSRGGVVNSEVFDHTSTLMFLERRFGVEVPAISQWRRETCGDLLTTLDLRRYDPSVPKLVDPAPATAEVLANCFKDQWPGAPKEQALPTVEA